MKKLLDKIIYKRHHLIMDETKVMDALKTVQNVCSSKRSLKNIDMAVGNCGWADTKKWFVHFTCSNRRWEMLRKELNVIRVFELLEIPENTNGNYYTKD